MERINSYTSIHNHTDFSNIRLIDSINRYDKLIDKAYELGLRGVAITDHETVSSHFKALKYYKEKYKDKMEEFKLILGNEIYITRSDLNSTTHQKGEKFYHFILLARNKRGHEQIRELSTRAWQRSYFKNMMRVPTFIEDLQEIIGNEQGNVIGTTACLGSFTGSKFLNNQVDEISDNLKTMENIFGKENFFIEIQPSFMDDQINYNSHMIINYWNKYNFVFSTDSHYLSKEQRKIHKWFLQSKEGEREVDAFYSSAYLMDYDELKSYFDFYISQEKIEVMRANTNHIWDMVENYELTHTQVVPQVDYSTIKTDYAAICSMRSFFNENIDLEKNPYLYYFLTTDNAADKLLMDLVLEGYYNKIFGKSSKVSIQKRFEQLNIEFEQLKKISDTMKQSLSNYFITMAKMIDIIWNEGDSIVGVSRGSAGAFLINYLIGITQMDPQNQPLELPYWRFIHSDRPGLPDIDIDTESTKRLKIFNKLQTFFNTFNSSIINVCTFGTEGSKSAIRTAGRALEIDDTLIGYLTSMIPNERGFDWTLSECYYGDCEKSRTPIKAFVEEMNNNKDLWELASSLEGLVTRVGVHASGILIFNNDVKEFNTTMKTSKGIVVSAFDLHDSEEMGGLKYDLLTVQALDKIRATLNYLLEDNRIEWQGDLRSTYNKYLLPINIDLEKKEMWDMLANGEIVDVFQFDTIVGSEAVRSIKPCNVGELAIANSVMRLMAQNDEEPPLKTYAKQKENIDIWYRELEMYNLSPSEIETLEPHLKPLSGVADSQESVMLLTMNPKISGFTLNEANSLRKAIAKKDADILAKTEKMFYEKGRALGTSEYLLNYVWNIQIHRQIGYSFSIIHTMGYSLIAVQEMNLAYFYPSIYWKTACLSVNAGAINDEDYYNLVDEGIIELSDEEDKRSQNKIQYGKVAAALDTFRNTIRIDLPDINKSRLGFTPDSDTNSILYGLKGITKVGDNIIQDIILNRPFYSLEDFVDKMTEVGEKGKIKKLISKDRVINLIKAGAFDRLEKKPREEIMNKFLQIIADQKKRITLQNFLMLIRKGLVPKELSEEIKCYNFTKYIRKQRIGDSYYILDDIALDYFNERFSTAKDKIKIINEKTVIPTPWWDSIYETYMNKVRSWISLNHDNLLITLNNELFEEEKNKYAKGTVLDWELQALHFYYSGHPLKDVVIPFDRGLTSVKDLKESEVIRHFLIKGKNIPELKLYHIFGTVIEKDKQKGIVTLSTVDGIIEVKFYKAQFAKYSHEVNDEDDNDNDNGNGNDNDDNNNNESVVKNEENYFEKGTHLIITGIKRGTVFIPKVYKKTAIPPVVRVVLDENYRFVDYRWKD